MADTRSRFYKTEIESPTPICDQRLITNLDEPTSIPNRGHTHGIQRPGIHRLESLSQRLILVVRCWINGVSAHHSIIRRPQTATAPPYPRRALAPHRRSAKTSARASFFPLDAATRSRGQVKLMGSDLTGDLGDSSSPASYRGSAEARSTASNSLQHRRPRV
jgi:hypothetical protein